MWVINATIALFNMYCASPLLEAKFFFVLKIFLFIS